MIRSPAGFDGGDRIKRYLDYYQPSYGVMMLSAGQFSPASLFAAGEQGAWYDPSDIRTLFQDFQGTMPVTAAGQAVGLLLDKSRGLVETTPNIDGQMNTATWTKGTGWSAPSARSLVCDGSQIGVSDCSASFTRPAGTLVRYTFNITAISGTLLVYPTGSQPASFTTTGPKTLYGDAIANFNIFRINGAGQTCTITDITIRAVSGNHATQSTPGARPILRQDANSRWYLEFDGNDDALSTATINPGSVDKAQVFAGVRRLADTAGVIAEYSDNWNSNAGSFLFWGGNSATGLGAGFNTASRGAAAAAAGQFGFTPATFTPPVTAVLAATHDIAGDLSVCRGNGVAGTNGTADKGAGNFGSYPLFIGSRGGSSFRFNGWMYGLIIRFSAANLDAATIAQTETWMNGKTGAY